MQAWAWHSACMDIRGHPWVSVLVFYFVWESPVIFLFDGLVVLGFIAVYSKLRSPQASWDSPVLLLTGVLGLQKGILPLHRLQEFKLKSLLLCSVHFMDCVISPALAFFLNAMNVHSVYKYDFVLSIILVTKNLDPAVTAAVLYMLWSTWVLMRLPSHLFNCVYHVVGWGKKIIIAEGLLANPVSLKSTPMQD